MTKSILPRYIFRSVAKEELLLYRDTAVASHKSAYRVISTSLIGKHTLKTSQGYHTLIKIKFALFSLFFHVFGIKNFCSINIAQKRQLFPSILNYRCNVSWWNNPILSLGYLLNSKFVKIQKAHHNLSTPLNF